MTRDPIENNEQLLHRLYENLSERWEKTQGQGRYPMSLYYARKYFETGEPDAETVFFQMKQLHLWLKSMQEYEWQSETQQKETN